MIIILDFGSQVAELIARRVRESHIYSEVLPHTTPFDVVEKKGAKGIILSGGPSSVFQEGAPGCDPLFFSGKIPVLGICYGMQPILRKWVGMFPKVLNMNMVKPILL